MKRLFSKPPLTIEQQTEHLIRKNMLISDRDYAAHCLSTIGFYHLSAYWFPYKTGAGSFRSHTDFNEIIALYEFDRNLRLSVFDAIERIEISVRASFVRVLSLKYGAHGYLDWKIYNNLAPLAKIIENTERELNLPSPPQFIKHYKDNYSAPELPPLWAAAELISFGALPYIIRSLKAPDDRNAIAKFYAFDEQIFIPVLRHITHIRNICAHQGRLWNRAIPFAPPLAKNIFLVRESLNPAGHSKIYNSFCYINYLLRNIAPQLQWQNIIIKLMDNRPSYAEMNLMGFPADWRQRPLWQ